MQGALALVAHALAAGIDPPPAVTPSLWAADNLTVPDGPRAGERWTPALTPYVIEPLDMLGPDSTVNEIAIMKSAQTGFTTLLIAAIGHSVDRDPCRIMVVQPTDAALSDFNREKLQPAIESSPALAAKVARQASRSGEGSTVYSKKFAGGSLTMAIASSAADLRSKTIKKLFRDEIDEYPDDLDGQGDPLKISDGRLTSFLSQGDWKKADVSTPTVKGASKIEARYEAGDQRRWHVRCPGCGDDFVFEFGANFRFERKFPFGAHYVAPCCGTIVENAARNGLVAGGRWIATDPRPGAFPSYRFDALSSPFVPWDTIAKEFIEAGDSPLKLKAFWNLVLGLPYEIKGDAPDHVRLLERREDGLLRGHVPADGLILTAAADVQMRGIWVEVTAFAQTRETFVVEALYLDGSTEDPNGEAFALLKSRVLDRDWPDAHGGTRRLDALGIDSGYRSHAVYAWVRANQVRHPWSGQDTVLALDGRDGWGKPPIGQPSLVDINLAGAKRKKGCKLWPVGTWPLKGAFYADVLKEGRKSGRETDPEGYCHFPAWLDETYFRQLTSEYLADERWRGRTRRIWRLKASERDNHFLDCRVYNLALAEHLGLSTLTPAEWAGIRTARAPSPSRPIEPPPAAATAAESGEATQPQPRSAEPAPPSRAAEPSEEEASIAKRLANLGKLNAERFR